MLENDLGYGDVLGDVDVLNGVEQLYAFRHRTLEGFAAADETRTAGALVDDGCGHGFFEVVGTRKRRRN